MNSSDERAEELDALQAIYGDCMVADSTYSGHIDISVKLQRPLKLTRIAQNQQEEVLYLPPVRICFKLPNGYPDAAAPLVSVDASWLPTEVARQLETTSSSTWEEYGRTQIMYAYVSYLEEAAGEAFGMHSLEVSDDVLKHLLVYNKDATRQVFQHGTYECGICLDPENGSLCYQIEYCEHVFCIECLQGYFSNAILTGNIYSVKYPAFRCGDQPTERTRFITPRELLRVPIERPIVQRYVDLKRKKKLESEASTIWCPRQWCQGAVKGNKYPRPGVSLEEMGVVFEDDADTPHHDSQASTDDTEDEATKDAKILSTRLQVCEDCSYAFCHLCKRTWHGDFFDCRARVDIPSEREIINTEEEASLTFIQRNTTRCHKCRTPVEKREACNHITCAQCQSHFCYLCSTPLDPWYPYGHYNKEGDYCYQRLWEGSNGEGVQYE